MAEDKIAGTPNEPKKDDNKLAVPKAEASMQHDHKPLALAGLLIVFLLLLGGAFMAGRHAWRNDQIFETRHFSSMQFSPDSAWSYGDGFRIDVMRGQRSTASNTRVSGVVTAVDGNTITVAGDGTTSKVTVSSNTAYSGSSEPAKVNDTITAVGAKDGSGVLIASSVYLSRQ